jgi:hypothetical protein
MFARPRRKVHLGKLASAGEEADEDLGWDPLEGVGVALFVERRDSGAPKGTRNGSYKHGSFTNEAIAERRELRVLIQHVRTLLADL